MGFLWHILLLLYMRSTTPNDDNIFLWTEIVQRVCVSAPSMMFYAYCPLYVCTSINIWAIYYANEQYAAMLTGSFGQKRVKNTKKCNRRWSRYIVGAAHRIRYRYRIEVCFKILHSVHLGTYVHEPCGAFGCTAYRFLIITRPSCILSRC